MCCDREEKNKWKWIVFWVLFVGLPFSAHADFATIDKRLRSEPLDYRISFCSRLSDGKVLPTHAFVVYTRAPHGSNAEFMLATGWAPVGKKIATDAVVGAFSEEILTDRSQTCLPVLVNAEIWGAALGVARTVNFQEVIEGDVYQLAERFFVYKMLETDCIKFFQTVASKVGLKVPDRKLMRPVEYVKALAHANAT